MYCIYRITNLVNGSAGFHHTDEAKKKIGESSKGNQYAKGKHHKLSEETKNKMSETRREMAEAYKKSGRKDWNTFQKEYKAKYKEK